MMGNQKALDHFNEMIEAYRKALIVSMGYRVSDLDKPLVGIIHGYNQMSPGNFNIKPVVESAKIAIAANGGIPVEIAIPGVCGSMSGGADPFRFNFPYRDAAAALAELLISINRLDACMFIPNCDNVVPAYLIAAVRVNVPSVFITGGYMLPGCYQGRLITAFDVPKIYASMVQEKGEMNSDEIAKVIESACPSAGACPEIGTANSMAVVTEALGLSLPGNASLASGEAQLIRMARDAGEKLMEEWRTNTRAKDIINKNAIEDAARVVLAVGGSPNVLLHLLALSEEAGAGVRLEDWDSLSRETPLLCRIKPNHPTYTMVDFGKAGGVYRLMGEMINILKPDRPTVMGITLREVIDKHLALGRNYQDSDVITGMKNPVRADGGLMVLSGNLAPEGAVVKVSAVSKSMWKFSGRVKVFDSEVEAAQALFAGKVAAGQVVVVRYEGPRGAPGAREVMLLMHAVVGMGLMEKIAVITDGRFSGTNLGLAVGHVCPEAMAGGPIGLLQDGDEVLIDLEYRLLEADLSEEELMARKAAWVPPQPKAESGLLLDWSIRGGSLAKGGILGR
ncbi:MAG: dihydroxy-acid dehydratase [Dehalobacterium sp.]